MKKTVAAATLMLVVASFSTVRAEGTIERAGVAVGVTAGNMWFVPIKAMTVGWSAIAGALSFVVTGGNAELTQQIWRDTTEGPYIITPEVARMAIGYRPELGEQE